MIGCAVGELLAGMERVLKVLDPEALSGPESLELFYMFHRIERLAAAGKALCARQMAASRRGTRVGTARPVISWPRPPAPRSATPSTCWMRPRP